MTDAVNNQPEQPDDVQFALTKLYVKDLSLEIPGAPDIFKMDYAPDVKMEMNSRSRAVAENEYEVELTVSLTATQEEKTIFVVEVQQAGIFLIKGLEEEIKMRHALSAYCPNMLFPYVREAVSNLITRGGFPQLLISPVNFDQLFASQLQQEQQQAASGEAQPAAAEATE